MFLKCLLIVGILVAVFIGGIGVTYLLIKGFVKFVNRLR